MAPMRTPSALEPRKEARRVPALSAHLLHLAVELIHEGGRGKGRTVLARLREADREVLAHPVDREAEVELALAHGLAAVLHLPRSCSALGDDVQHRLEVEPSAFAEMNALREALDQPGDADLVYHLRELARSGRAHEAASPSEAHDGGLGPLINVRVSAAHDGQHAVLRSRLAAGDRSIDEADALRSGDLVELPRDLRRRGGVIDENRARFHGREGAVRSQRYLPQVVVVADACEHDLLSLGSPARRRGRATAVLGRPLFSLGSGPVVD